MQIKQQTEERTKSFELLSKEKEKVKLLEEEKASLLITNGDLTSELDQVSITICTQYAALNSIGMYIHVKVRITYLFNKISSVLDLWPLHILCWFVPCSAWDSCVSVIVGAQHV
jgi:hypothetical protein